MIFNAGFVQKSAVQGLLFPAAAGGVLAGRGEAVLGLHGHQLLLLLLGVQLLEGLVGLVVDIKNIYISSMLLDLIY